MDQENKNNTMVVHEISLSDISPNPYQPRRSFDEEKLSAMADSIVRHGIMQPIVVTKKSDGTYELISGERRWRSSKIAGKKTIPAVVREHEHSDKEKFELSIIENIQREDLSPIDKSKAFEKLSNQFGYTHGEIAQKMGKSREYISNSLRLLLLPDVVAQAIDGEILTEGHARPLLVLKDRPYEQEELFKKILSQKLTVRAAEKIARSIISNKFPINNTETSDPDIKVMEKKLAEKLGTKVHIDEKTSGEGGKLTIEYFSKEDLEKIINLVRGKGLSAAPVLEYSSEESGIEKFENNFTNDIEHNLSDNQAEQNKTNIPTSIFTKEIEELESVPEVISKAETESVKINLEEEGQSVIKKVEEKVEENSENLGGYDISFNNPQAINHSQTIFEKENLIVSNQDELVEQEVKKDNKDLIDNFQTIDWEKKEEKYQENLKKEFNKDVENKEIENVNSNLESIFKTENLDTKIKNTELINNNEEIFKKESLEQTKPQVFDTIPTAVNLVDLDKENFVGEVSSETDIYREQKNNIANIFPEQNTINTNLENSEVNILEKNTINSENITEEQISEIENSLKQYENKIILENNQINKNTSGERMMATEGMGKVKNNIFQEEKISSEVPHKEEIITEDNLKINQNKEGLEEKLEELSVYEQFLESKKKIEEEKRKRLMKNNNVLSHRQEKSSNNIPENIPEKENSPKVTEENNNSENLEIPEVNPEINPEEIKVENVFDGSDFLPEKKEPEVDKAEVKISDIVEESEDKKFQHFSI